ncbi:MAG: hypothetical protein Q8Q01_03245 [archaeon]|nr:hypothetical protein [archaeon]
MNYLEKLLSLTALSATLYGCGGTVDKIEPTQPSVENGSLRPGNYYIKGDHGNINLWVIEDPISTLRKPVYDCLAHFNKEGDGQLLLFDNSCDSIVDYVVRRLDSGEENIILRFQLIMAGQVSAFDNMMNSLIEAVKSGEISPTNDPTTTPNLDGRIKYRGRQI